jgi:diguanylate cyclase (GGDEF)-like protein
MRLSGRHDGLLIAGFAFALLVIFERSFQYLLQVARDIEATYGVALLPALFVLCAIMVFHHYSKRQEMKAEAVAAAAEASQARERTRELERLVTLGQALSRALTMDALREALWRHLPPLVDGHDLWILTRASDRWQPLLGFSTDRPESRLEAIAEGVLGRDAAVRTRPEGCDHEGHVCFPMVVGAQTVGVLGIAPGALPPDEAARRMVGAAAALVAIAVRNTQLFSEVRDNSLRDALTGCFNRKHGLEVLESELSRARRSDQPLSILMFDVDRFKDVNDRHGHLCGDAVLAAIGQRMAQALRRSDLRCRYGGDEFLVVLPDTSAAAAARVADWLLRELHDIRVPAGGETVAPSVSIGFASALQGEVEAEALIARADAALYQAKTAGRNCAREHAPAPLRFPASPRVLAVATSA